MLSASEKCVKMMTNTSVGENDMQVMRARIISEEQCRQTQIGVG